MSVVVVDSPLLSPSYLRSFSVTSDISSPPRPPLLDLSSSIRCSFSSSIKAVAPGKVKEAKETMNAHPEEEEHEGEQGGDGDETKGSAGGESKMEAKEAKDGEDGESKTDGASATATDGTEGDAKDDDGGDAVDGDGGDGDTEAKGGDDATAEMEAEVEVEAEEGMVPVFHVDLNDGSHLINFCPPAEGEYTIDIEYIGTFGGESGRIGGGTLQTSFVSSSKAQKNSNALDGPLMVGKVKADIKEMTGALAKRL